MDLESISVETELFEHREVKPHFINPCCFGEDFARWLRGELADLAASGFELSEPIQAQPPQATVPPSRRGRACPGARARPTGPRVPFRHPDTGRRGCLLSREVVG